MKTQKLTRIVIKPVGQPAYIAEMVFDLAYMQQVVGGYVQCVPFGDYTVWCNEEGKLEGMPANIVGQGDVLCGAVIITGNATASGSTNSLTVKQAKAAEAMANICAVA